MLFYSIFIMQKRIQHLFLTFCLLCIGVVGKMYGGVAPSYAIQGTPHNAINAKIEKQYTQAQKMMKKSIHLLDKQNIGYGWKTLICLLLTVGLAYLGLFLLLRVEPISGTLLVCLAIVAAIATIKFFGEALENA